MNLVIMYLYVIFLFISATPPISSSVWKIPRNDCSSLEFACADGECVELSAICDGQIHCSDGSDEMICNGTSDTSLGNELVLSRARRQATTCRKNQWRCRDGTCIGIDGKCDGVVDCPDRSDETHALCRKNQCQSNWFRCTYGACVDGTAPCNNITECADNSDELLPRCRNENDEVKGNFKCQNGQMIPAANLCDGVTDCKDGSDETVRSCAGKTCYSYLFQCAYGACVDQGADCNGITECADGSDEADELCNKSGSGSGTTNESNTGTATRPPPNPNQPVPSGKCQLPAYPPNGRYQVYNVPNARPFQISDSWIVDITCNPGYGILDGENRRFCSGGGWSPTEKMPDCVPFCKLNRHPSVQYRCKFGDSGSLDTRSCNNYEPPGTIAIPECVTPNYFSYGELSSITCNDEGMWSDNPTCLLACGEVTPGGVQLISNGEYAKLGELPWHTGIYKKTASPYEQICGGSLVRPSVVISAAHCFWDDNKPEGEKLQPASNYAVAVGKLYRPWNDPVDNKYAQKADVISVNIPSRFRGVSSNFMEDLAVLQLSKLFEYKPHISPVCLSFVDHFDQVQLAKGVMAKVAGWGVTSPNGRPSPTLKVVDLPIVPYIDCYNLSPPTFRRYITGDKICAGYKDNGTAVCKGDSGGGLVVASTELGITRYYLRGIVSTAPDDVELCVANDITTFTHVIKHDKFIKNYL